MSVWDKFKESAKVRDALAKAWHDPEARRLAAEALAAVDRLITYIGESPDFAQRAGVMAAVLIRQKQGGDG